MKRHTLSLVALLIIVAVATVGAADYKIDPVHSFVNFDISYGGFGRAYGNFQSIEGDFSFDAANLAAASMEVVIKADTVWTGNSKRDDHLRSPDFFNVKQFPVITFKSRSFAKNGDAYTVTGDLSMHGVTKEVTADFEVIGQIDGAIGGEATFKVKRSEFGMTFMLDRLGDEVTVRVAIIGQK